MEWNKPRKLLPQEKVTIIAICQFETDILDEINNEVHEITIGLGEKEGRYWFIDESIYKTKEILYWSYITPPKGLERKKDGSKKKKM
jgi:hypothetical protein